MNEYCQTCGAIIPDGQSKELLDISKDERKIVGLWSKIYYVTEDEQDERKGVFLDATRTEAMLKIMWVLGQRSLFTTKDEEVEG